MTAYTHSHTNTHLGTLMLHCIIPLFEYVSLSGAPLMFVSHSRDLKEGKKKNLLLATEITSLVRRFDRRFFELLKGMWNYLTKAWDEVPNLPLCGYLRDSPMSSENHQHSRTTFLWGFRQRMRCNSSGSKGSHKFNLKA